MYLWCKETEKAVFIAKRYGDGWFLTEETVKYLCQSLDLLFDDAGPTDNFILVFETEDTPWKYLKGLDGGLLEAPAK